MNIGELKETTTKAGKCLTGHISTLEISRTIELEPALKSDNPNAPTYIVWGWSDSGTRVQIGAAWVKAMKRGDRVGEDFVTITIDDPSLRRPLNVAAFRNSNSDNWEITFRRRQERAA